MDFLLVLIPSSLLQTAVCSHWFVCNVVLCRLGWFVDRVIITGRVKHFWTRVRPLGTRKSEPPVGPGPCYWVVYSAAGCGAVPNEIRFLFRHIWWLEARLSPVMNPRWRCELLVSFVLYSVCCDSAGSSAHPVIKCLRKSPVLPADVFNIFTLAWKQASDTVQKRFLYAQQLAGC